MNINTRNDLALKVIDFFGRFNCDMRHQHKWNLGPVIYIIIHICLFFHKKWIFIQSEKHVIT